MSFFNHLRAERHVAEIKTSPDRTRPATGRAIARLKSLGSEAIEAVLTALPDADQGATVAFVEVLSALLTERTFPHYLRGLMTGNARVVSGIAWALTGARSYPPFLLLEALATPKVAKDAVLGVITAQKARFTVRELLVAAHSHEPTEKAALFRIIGEIADESAIPELISLLQGKDTMARVHIINLLARLGGPEVRGALGRLLKDPNKLIRGTVLTALMGMAGPIDTEAICALLPDPEIDVQSRAIDLLIAKANSPATVPHLVKVVKSDKEYVRRAAVEVLNEIGDGPSVKELLVALKGSDWQVRSRATDTLGKTGGARVVAAALQLVHDPDEVIRRMAIDVLSQAKDKDESVVQSLLAATRDPDAWVSERAVEALAEIGSRRAVPRLIEMLRSDNARALPVVVRALGRLGDAGLIDTLLPLLSRPERELRVEAIQALGNLADGARADEVRSKLKAQLVSADQSIAPIARAAIEVIKSRTASFIVATGGSRTGVGRPGGRTKPHKAEPQASSERAKLPAKAEPAAAREGLPVSRRLDITRLRPGDVLEERYRYIERIGRGAFGTVLLMEDTVVGERLILKFLNPDLATDEEVIRRFVHELRYSRKITHENVIRIYDFHYVQGNYAISMEYFPSHTLGSELTGETPLEFGRALKFGIDICRGMTVAHQVGIVHRDLKPANVLINESDLLKIVDFGVAAAHRESSSEFTKPGFVIGSPKYMAPEQIQGKGVDERADIYALGVILYEMTTGVPPYSGGDHVSIMYQHVQGKACPPRELNPALSAGFSGLIMQTMAVEKSRRFQSMQELRLALEQHG
jgi:serine/threonine-protein kinase